MGLITVVVPFRPVNKDRQKIWRFLKRKWSVLFDVILETDSPSIEWNKSLAISNAVQDVRTKYTMILDADVWIDEIEKVIRYLYRHEVNFFMPHRYLCRLNEGLTRGILEGQVRLESFRHASNLNLDENAGRAMPGGGCLIVRTSILKDVVFDPRHPSWGNEDRDWWIAATTLVGPAPPTLFLRMIHFYHEKQIRMDRSFGNEEDKALHERYKSAANDKTAMRLIIEEARESTVNHLRGGC